MKNFFYLFPLLFCGGVYAAPIGFSEFLRTQTTAPLYLSDASDAWSAVLENAGTGGRIATYMNGPASSNLAQYLDLMSVIAYNDSALNVFTVTQHTDEAFYTVSHPLMARRRECLNHQATCTNARHTLVPYVRGIAHFADYDSNKNDDFKTRTSGVSVGASGYVTDGLTFGVSYTRTMTDTRDAPFDTDITGNSITLFSKYLARTGFFMNSGINGGHLRWESDKQIAGIENANVYNTDFFGGQITSGINLSRGRITITPRVNAKYVYLKSDRHTDAAAQEFDKWWYNTLTATGGVDMGFDFGMYDFTVHPYFSVGGGYDVISHGTDAISVRVLSGQRYDIPINVPHRASGRCGMGINFQGTSFAFSVDYELDVRTDYMAHNAMASVRFAF